MTPEGVLAGSRWLSEAIPPVNRSKMISIPEGSQHARQYLMLASLQDASAEPHSIRWYRYAQPPANGYDPFGIKLGLRAMPSLSVVCF